MTGKTVPSTATDEFPRGGQLTCAHRGLGLRPEDAVDLRSLARVAGEIAELELLLQAPHRVALAAPPDRHDQRPPGGRPDDPVDRKVLVHLEGASCRAPYS